MLLKGTARIKATGEVFNLNTYDHKTDAYTLKTEGGNYVYNPAHGGIRFKASELEIIEKEAEQEPLEYFEELERIAAILSVRAEIYHMNKEK